MKKPIRNIVHVPGKNRWQWLGFEVTAQCRQIMPSGIATGELDESRFEHEPKQQETVCPNENR